MTNDKPATGEAQYAPCSTCGQYSHSIGDDALSEAFLHFETMIAHPVRGHAMGHAFDDKTRDMAQRLMAAARHRARVSDRLALNGGYPAELPALATISPDDKLREALRVAKSEIRQLGCDPDDIERALARVNRAALGDTA